MKRREFLQATTGGVVGLASVLAFRQPPATAQTRELTVLSFNHFVPQSDEELRKQAAEFSRRVKAKVTIDTIAGLQLPAKLTAEVQTGAGHDVVALPRSSPYLYKKHLADLDELAEELGARDGGWYDFSRDYTFVDGHWKGLYWLWACFPGLYNKRQFDEAGLAAPDTWEDLLKAGRVLKKRGHPVGIYILPNMAAKAVTGTPIREAITWGEGEVRKVLEGKAG